MTSLTEEKLNLLEYIKSTIKKIQPIIENFHWINFSKTKFFLDSKNFQRSKKNKSAVQAKIKEEKLQTT